jgi:hypothetical protein
MPRKKELPLDVVTEMHYAEEKVRQEAAAITLADRLARLAEPAQEATAAERDARQAEAAAHVGDLLARGRGAETKLGQLRAKHLDKIQAVANTDFKSARASLPHDFVVGTAVSPTRSALHALENVAREAVAALTSTLGDRSRDKNDIDPISLRDAMNEVRMALDGGHTHDTLTGALAGGFRRGVSHLRVWVERGERTAAAAEDLVARFDVAAARAEAALAEVRQ